MSIIPDYMISRYGSTRKFRVLKRRELDAAIKAMRLVIYGSAFAPNLTKVGTGTILKDMEKLRQRWTQKEWGR